MESIKVSGNAPWGEKHVIYTTSIQRFMDVMDVTLTSKQRRVFTENPWYVIRQEQAHTIINQV